MDGKARGVGKSQLGPKVARTRRSWNSIEEQLLADLLKEAVTRGWKSDNGFKNGYLNWLQQEMEKHSPNSKLSGSVHISSKITGWKRLYGHLSTLSRVSGLGWNSNTNMVTVDDEQVWQEYVRVNPEVESMRHKSYPFYQTWCDVFGKDRATGEQALGFEEAEKVAQCDYFVDTSQMGSEDDVTSKTKPVSPCPSFNPTSHSGKSSLSGKKRNAPESSTGPLMQVADEYLKKSEALFLSMVEKLGLGEMSYADKSKVVLRAVEEVPELSEEAIIYITQKILNNPANMETFLNSGPDRRATMVKMVLRGEIS